MSKDRAEILDELYDITYNQLVEMSETGDPAKSIIELHTTVMNLIRVLKTMV